MLVIIGFIICFVTSVTFSTPSTTSVSEVDLVLEELSAARWGPDEECRAAVLDLLQGVKNQTLWATWVWDATARPSGLFYGSQYQLGGYSQCLNTPWPARTKYCLADVLLSHWEQKDRTKDIHHNDRADEYFDYKTRYGRNMGVVTWGVCTPDVCTDRGVQRLLPLMLRHSHLHTTEVISVDSCQVPGEKHQRGIGYYGFMWMFTILLSTTILATFYKKSTNCTLLLTILNSWCMERNWSELMKVTKDDIQTLNGVRVSNSFIFVIVHYVYYSNSTAVLNYLDVEQFLARWPTARSLVHSDIGIDTFFTLSGLLHMKGLLSSKQLNLWRILGRRYVRLLGVYGTAMWFVAAVLPGAGDGPLWKRLVGPEARDCAQNWWLSLLMISNFINCENICYIISWYIQCDFQLTVLSALLFWVWTKNRRVGSICFLTVAVIGFLLPAIITYWKQLPPIYLNNAQNGFQIKDNVFLTSVYVKSYCRTNAYFIGMAMGYILTAYKPTEYKKIIPKELSLALVFGSLYVLQNIMLTGGQFFGKDYTGAETLMFVTLNRCTWALAICILITACEYGTVPLIGSFLRSNLHVPMSRLTYGIYLLHMLLVYRIVNTIHAPITSDFITLVAGGIGIFVLTVIVSLSLWFTIEAPLTNISYLLFKSKEDSAMPLKENGTAKTNIMCLRHASEPAGEN